MLLLWHAHRHHFKALRLLLARAGIYTPLSIDLSNINRASQQLWRLIMHSTRRKKPDGRTDSHMTIDSNLTHPHTLRVSLRSIIPNHPHLKEASLPISTALCFCARTIHQLKTPISRQFCLQRSLHTQWVKHRSLCARLGSYKQSESGDSWLQLEFQAEPTIMRPEINYYLYTSTKSTMSLCVVSTTLN